MGVRASRDVGLPNGRIRERLRPTVVPVGPPSVPPSPAAGAHRDSRRELRICDAGASDALATATFSASLRDGRFTRPAGTRSERPGPPDALW